MIPYIISYLVVGVLLALSALFHETFAGNRRLAGFLFTVLMWPIFVFAAPEPFFETKSKRSSEEPASRDTLKETLDIARRDSGGIFSTNELNALAQIAARGNPPFLLLALGAPVKH